MYPEYRATAPLGLLGRCAFILSSHYLRLWDVGTSARVDYFATNSPTSAARIRKVYRREAEVIHCPIQVAGFRAAPVRDGFYLVLSRLVRYKRVDLAIEACSQLRRELVVVGGGEEAARLRRIAGPTVRLLGEAPDATVRGYLGRRRALLFCGEEDQGLTPLEAQASGAPVIAYGRGGALETVRGGWVGEEPPPAATGIFFARQDAAAVAGAIEAFERREAAFSAAAAREQAERFDVNAFYQQMADFVTACLGRWGEMNGYSALGRPGGGNGANPALGGRGRPG
jgi:glycosyltransferase involved in cell wall biosynthesis